MTTELLIRSRFVQHQLNVPSDFVLTRPQTGAGRPLALAPSGANSGQKEADQASYIESVIGLAFTAKRYLQERRRLEEQIVHHEQEKRQVGNSAIIEMLKKEFSNQKPSANAVMH